MTSSQHRAYDLESLEPRLLLSADGFGLGVLQDPFQDEIPAQHEILIETEAGLETGASGSDSLYDGESVTVVFNDAVTDQDAASELESAAPDESLGEHSTTAVPEAQEIQNELRPEATPGLGAETVAELNSSGTYISADGGVIPEAVEAAQSTDDPVAANPFPEILTETLRNANGPPVIQDGAVDAASSRIIALNDETVQTIGNELVVTEGETLKGTWSSSVDLIVRGGTVSPGNSPGVQNVGTFTMLSGEEVIEIAGAGGVAGVDFDQINVAGLATLGGSARLKIVLLGGYVPAVGMSFPVMNWGSVSGEFANYLGTASIGNDRAFVPVYSASGLVLTVAATPVYDPVKAQIESLIDTLGDVGGILNTAGDFAAILPVIGDDIGGLVDMATAIQGVLLDKLNDLGAGLSIADVTAYLEGLDGTAILGYTLRVDGIIANFGAAITDPVSWKYDIYFTRTDSVSYDLGEDLPFDGTLAAAASASVTSRFDLDFIFGKDATGYYVGLEEFKACVEVAASPTLSLSFSAPFSASATASGAVALTACLALTPNASILSGGKIYLSQLTALGNGSSSVITNFTWTPTGSVNVDLTLNVSSVTLGPGITLNGATGHLKISGGDIFNEAPGVDIDFTGANLTLPGLPTIIGNFDFNTDGSQNYLDVNITQLRLAVGTTRILDMIGNVSLVVGDSTLAGKADLTLQNGPALANLTVTGGVWHLELNTGSSPATVPYNGGTAVIPAGPYLRVEGVGTGVGFTINPAFTLLGNFVFEKSGGIVLVGASDVSFGFTEGATELMSITNGTGGFRITSAGVAGVLAGEFSEAIPVVEVTGTFGAAFNTTGAAVSQTISVGGESIIIDVPAGNYLRMEGDDAVLSVMGVSVSGDFIFESRDTITGGDLVITVGATGVNFAMGDLASDLVSISDGSGAFYLTASGIAGTATVDYSVDVFGIASASGTGTLVINNLAVPVSETVEVLGANITIAAPAGPYLRVDTTATTLTILDSVVSGDFSYEQKTTGDGSEVVSVAATDVEVSLKQGAVTLMTLTGGSGYFIFTDDGVAGTAEGTVTEALPFISGLTASGSFSLEINTTNDAVDESYTLNGATITVDVPEGPYLKITGDEVTFALTVGGGLGAITVQGDFGFEQKSTGGVLDYIKIGATDLDLDITAVGITLEARDGAGAFILTSAGFAGEATLGSFDLTGAAAFIADVQATGMLFRINTTGADVSETVSVSSSEEVELDFTGAYYHHYVGISGAVTVELLSFADFSGNLSFELFDVAGTDTIRIAASDLSLSFNLSGSNPLISFFNGSGGFVITSAGIAGTATLQFQTGFVNVSGTITLELNTTAAAASYSWTAPSGSPVSFSLTQTNYLRVCVNGSVAVGTISIPVNFTIEESGGVLQFSRKTGSPGDLFSIAADGTISFGSYWTSLGLGSDFDFANPSPEEILTFLQRLANWFSLLSGSSLFDVVIPFTNGITLGEGVDWLTGFVDQFYSQLVSTEIAVPLPGAILPGSGPYNGSFSLQFAGESTIYNINFSGDYVNGLTGALGITGRINAGLIAAGIYSRVRARLNRDGMLSLALTENEIRAGTTGFTITLGNGAFIDMGFSITSNAQTISRYTLEQFPLELSNLLGLGTPITYDPLQKLYIFPVDLVFAGSTYNVDFDFGTEIGPLGSASLSGSMEFKPELRFKFDLGLDLNPADIPRIFSSQFIPAPSNGRITSSFSFQLYLNNSASPITVTLNKSATNTNNSLADLAADLNQALTSAANYTPPGGSPVDLLQLVRFDAAGTVLALSGVNEDFDFDGKRDTAEDTNGNGYLDAGEDDDGDGVLDVNEPDWDSDGVLDNRTGMVTQIRLTVDQYSTFATELGFGDTIEDPTGANPYGYFESIANAPMKGFFLDNVDLEASLTITTPGNIAGQLVFGFLEVQVVNGIVETRNPFNAPDAMKATVGIRDPTNGNARFYMPELMDVLSDIGTYVDFSLSNGIYAGLSDITADIGGSSVLSSGEISVWIPDINDLTYNENAYNISDARTDNDTGIFLTYPNVGLSGGFSFEEISFTDILQGLEAVVDKLSEFSAFSFLDEKIPLIDLSLHDLVDYAGQFADLVEAVTNADADSIQAVLEELEASIEALFHIDPNTFDITFDTYGIDYSSSVSSDVITHSGSGGAPTMVTFDPAGFNDGFTLTRDINGSGDNGTTLRLKGSSSITGNAATVSWDQDRKLITILINPGTTTAATIINAINATIGADWTAANTPGSDGSGLPRTNAIKFHWAWTTAYADEIPLHLDIVKLLSGLGGDNPSVQSFLAAASSILHVEGNGLLNVSASAGVTLDFGLDLTNPSTVTPFLYDTTGVELKAKVSVTDLEFEAAIGALGVFIRGGEVVFDYDGGGIRTDSAVFTVGLKNLDGDNRHYFDSSLLSLDSIGITAHAGIKAELPLFAPVDSIPIGGSTADNNGDGFADNSLGVDIPDLVRLLMGDTTARFNATQAERVVMLFGGNNNDLRLNVAAASGLHGVKVQFSNTGAVSASYSGGTITFGIDSGNTSALDLVNYVTTFGISGAPVGAFSLSLENGDPGVNSGAGKLSKVAVAAPDLTDLFGDMDLCEIIDSAAGPLLDGLDATLEDIQEGLEQVVLNTKLPLLGDGLAGAASFIEEFRNGLLADLRERINAANGSAVGALEDAIKEGIWNALGPDGLNILADFETGAAFDEDATFDDLDVMLSCDDGLVANLRLKKFLALLDTTQNPIDFDIGVPGFGLEVDGNVVLGIGFDLRLVFGFNKTDGFYLGTEGGMEDPELVLEFSATIPGLHAAGELFFLQLDVMDSETDPSHFTGGFYVDLEDPNGDGKLTFSELTSADFEDIVHGELAAEAEINLSLAASFAGDARFPRLLADFHLGWEWSLEDGAGDPEIEFGNIRLDLGSFISDVIGPILEEIQKVTQPLQPIIDIVTMELPILSELAGKPITFLTLAEAFGYLDPGTVKFIQQVLQVVDFINSIPTGSGSIYIPLGSFLMEKGDDGSYSDTNPLGNLSEIDLDSALASLGSESTASSTQISQTSGFMGDVGSLDNFKLPWLSNPSELFGLFVGKPVRLFEWQMPTFKFQFTYTQKIPIYPPLYAQFGGTIGATIDIGFGYDTYGIQKFIEGGAKNVIDIFDGFYIADYDANGNERAELTLLGEIFAGVSISLGPVEVGVQGGIGVTVEFDLNDVEDDGRVRISELVANAQQDPRCIFDIHGEVYLFLEAFLKVDLFFFEIDKTWRFGEFLLFSFDITCPEPVLASASGGVLTIHVGDNAGLREEIDTADGSETFVIKHLEGTAGSETVEVQWGHYTQTFGPDNGFVFSSIKADLGEGNDYIDFTGVLTAVTVNGGAGNDTIILGLGPLSVARGDDGDDTITAGGEDGIAVTGVTLEGGNGADLLTGRNDAITIRGDGGSDTIYGTAGDDMLYGGDGADIIYAYGGNDSIWGDAGNDTIYADAGDDTVEAGDGNDVVEAGTGNDRVSGGSGSDLLYGSEGNDLIAGGTGDDQIYGHGGVDLLVGDDFDMGSVDASEMTALAAAGSAGGSFSLKGITGSGNDMIIGGGSYDVLFGGDGDDFLFGGNYFSGGASQVIEEDDNDFIDGGRGNDEIYGDDSFGKTGLRITGISAEGTVFHDLNLSNLYDDGDRLLPGVRVKLFKASDDSMIAETLTDSAGRWKFLGLDPNDYYLEFTGPSGYTLVTQDAASAAGLDDPNEPSNDSDANTGTQKTAAFQLDYDEAETTITAGYQGAPSVTLTTEAVYERGEGQTSSATFTVTLSGPSGQSILFDYYTEDGPDDTPGYGSAQSGDNDYVAIPELRKRILTFAPGETVKTITVQITGDNTYERHEGFMLVLKPKVPSQIFGSPASISAKQTIINDDSAPSISITDVTVIEPTVPGATTLARFAVRLSNQHYAGLVTVDYLTSDAYLIDGSASDRSATAGAAKDYLALSPATLTFGAGEVEKFIFVTVRGDNIDEYDEAFYVNLFNPAFATIADDRGYGIIVDTDAAPTVTITPQLSDGDLGGQSTTVFEGNSVTQEVYFDVTLHGETQRTVTVTWDAARGTAVPGFDGAPGDYLNPSTSDQADDDADSDTTLVFTPNGAVTQTRTVSVAVHGDFSVEAAEEQFYVNLLTADGATITKNHVTVRVVDDDSGSLAGGPFDVRFARTQFEEYETDGLKTGYITLVRTPGPTQAYAVLSITGGSATNFPGVPADYLLAQSQLIVFAANEYVKLVPVTIFGDLINEYNETITFSLRRPTGAPGEASNTATLTIIDDDDVSIMVRSAGTGYTENSGTQHKFEILLVDAENPDPMVPRETEKVITFNYRTLHITTSAGDIVAIPLTADSFTSADGDTPKAKFVTVNGDAVPEFSEVFRFRVSDVFGAGTYQPQADGVIADDDASTITGLVFQDLNRNGYWDEGESAFENVEVVLTDSAGTVTTTTTDASGLYSASAVLGTVTFRINETAAIEGWELTTDNDSQTVQWAGSSGLTPLTPAGYGFTFTFSFPTTASTVGRGGTDDTIFGGPGDDYIDAGWGDDHVIGGHWQTATDSNAPINDDSLGDPVYDATVIANIGGAILNPQTAPIWTVDTSVGAGTGSIRGDIWLDLNNNDRQDEANYTGEVVVTLLDCESNVIDILATTTGTYLFDRLYDGEYYVQFSLPEGMQFVAPNVGADNNDSDAQIAGATAMITLAVGENRVNVDAGLEDAGTLPVSSTSTVKFAQPEWHVNDTAGTVTITLVRSNASTAEAIVWFAQNGTALAGTHYAGTQGVVVFGIGETLASFEIPVLDTGLDSCDVLDFKLNVRRPTGQPVRGGQSTVYLHGEGASTNTDNDTILGGDDWDVILGDSGHIDANAVQAPSAHARIDDFGGLGYDMIYGNDGPDYLNGQLGHDVLAGGEGEDIVYAGYGDDRVVVELDDDVIYGGHGSDTVAGVSPQPYITLLGGGAPQELRFGKALYDSGAPDPADSEFTLHDIERAEIFGTPGNDFITIDSFAGEVFIFGNDGDDTLSITADVDTITAADASVWQQAVYFLLYGFNVEANVTLSSGAAYHFGEMEDVFLTGGAGNNTIDASGTSFDITFDGSAGNDTLIGGSGDDTFLFDVDDVLGSDTVTGNGGSDTITFAGSTADAALDLAIVGSVQTVRGGFFSLTLTAEDIEGAVGGDGDDILRGNSLDNFIDGGLGDDLLSGRAGSETYSYDLDTGILQQDEIEENAGDAGHDVIDFSATSGHAVTLNMQLSAAQTVGGGLTLIITGTGVEEVIGGALNDILTGNISNNTLRGGAGDDTLFGAGGDDFLDGGSGEDVLDGGSGMDSIAASANSHFALSDVKLLRNGSDVDWLFSIDSADLRGGTGNNIFTLTGWSGDVSINGMGGTDSVVFAADADLLLSTAGPVDSLDINSGSAVFTAQNVERWTLSGGVSDNVIDASLYTRPGGFLTLNGNGGADTITGSSGDDVIDGGTGNDTITAGGGSDTVNGGTGTDEVTESTDYFATVTPSGLTIERLVTGVETDDHSSIEQIVINGGAGSQYFLYTGAAASVTSIAFHGAAGTGDLVYASGSGTLTVTNVSLSLPGAPPIVISGMEFAYLLGGSGPDLLNASSFSGAALLAGGAGDDTLIGTSGNDSLLGGEGNDRLVGLAGSDTLNGGDGDDTYVFDTDSALGSDTVVDSAGSDTFDFSASAAGNTVNLTLAAIPVNANLTINMAVGTAIENLTGGSGVDVFTGTADSNILTGNGGNDTLDGGLGDDTYVFDADSNQGADTLIDAGGVDTLDFSGTSSVNLTVNLTLAGAQQVDPVTLNLSITGASSMENVTGGGGNDTLTGNGLANMLTGNGGNDTLIGNSGADTLNGGAGDDILTGGQGNDVYVFNAGTLQGSDTLTEVALFGGRDTLDFSATSGVGVTVDLSLTTLQDVVPGNLRITLNVNNSFEDVIGGSGNDVLTGNSQLNVFTGNAGNDTIHGSAAGNDRIAETRDADFDIADVSATQAQLVIDGSETDILHHIHYATLTGGESDNILDASGFGSMAAATAYLYGMDGDDTLIAGGFDAFDPVNGGNPLFTAIMYLTGGTGNDLYVFDLSMQASNTIEEISDAENGLHDTISGAGGGLIDLNVAALQFPDSVNYPMFSLTFFSASSVEHTL